MLAFAKEIIVDAGEILKHHFNSPLEIKTKSTNRDLVTQADIEAEKFIISAIQEQFPNHAILAEEHGEIGISDYIWLIDPIDGTTNFAHSHPMFCSVIALAYHNEIILTAIYDPLRDELFSSEYGKGAFLNDQPITVSSNFTLASSVLVTGFPYDRATNPKNNMKEFCKIMPQVQGIRRSGSAALDMCYIACGRLDGYWEFHLNPWDFAGGVLLVREAGGKISNVDGSNWSITSNNVIAANKELHQEILEVLNHD